MIDNKKTAIYIGGLLQGIALVAFPAASTILTGVSEYNLSNTQYGSLFIPQALFSIAASALNPFLIRKFGSKAIYLGGLFANLFAMFLLTASVVVMKETTIAYSMLLLATTFLGLGFGMLVPTLNGTAALLFPKEVDSKLLMLNALLGIGTALAPVFVGVFVSLGFWWGLPGLLVLLLSLLIIYSVPLALPGGKTDLHSMPEKAIAIPVRFWIFAAFALLYGIVETINGNWLSIYMEKHLHASIGMQSLALTSFWGMVTFGRLFFSVFKKYISEEFAFQISPFISAAAFVVIAMLPSGHEYWAVVAFGLTGFGCSTLLPLIISYGNQQFKVIASSVPGMVISCYLLGYGIAAFGVGPLEEIAQISLREIYLFGAVFACFLGVLSLIIVSRNKQSQNKSHPKEES